MGFIMDCDIHVANWVMLLATDGTYTYQGLGIC